MTPDTVLRRALVIAVSADGGGAQLAIEHAVNRVSQTLEGHFGFVIERCVGERATRRGILEALGGWVDRCRADHVDVCVLYYFGHGGRVQFVDFPGVLEEVFGYVTCRRVEAVDAEGRWPFEGVLGCELSAKLSTIAEPGRSVVAILDCCYAGQLVRGGRSADTVRRASAPAWIREFLDGAHAELAVDYHPEIGRLVGSTPKRESFARTVGRAQIGFMTEALLGTIDEFDHDCVRATWDGVARRVRQLVIDEVGEGQWVSFAGPRERLLFSTVDAPVPPTVGLVVDPESPRHAWLRVGALQGVEVGDRWGVTSPLVEVGGGPASLAVGEVVQVDRSRARVEFGADVDVGQLRSNAAQLLAAMRRVEVETDDEVLREHLRSSAWLRLVARGRGSWAVGFDGSGIVTIADRCGSWPIVRLTDHGDLDAVIELLEDRARSERLLAALPLLADDPSGRCLDELPVAWCWGVVGEDGELSEPGATLRRDARLWFRFESRWPRAQRWFVNVIYIDIAGRPWQLNARVPNGIELERGDREALGLRTGAAGAGLRLPRSEGIEGPVSGRAKIVVLETPRPLELDHLVRGVSGSTTEAYAMQGLRSTKPRGDRRRGSRLPDLVLRWAVQIVDLEIR